MTWTPGSGVRPEPLHRLRAASPRPEEPFYEIRNNSTFVTFDQLMGDLAKISTRELVQSLETLVSDSAAHGIDPLWKAWFDYLLPRLLPRCHESDGVNFLLEYLVTGFMLFHPDEPLGFGADNYRLDILDTLGLAMMDQIAWSGDRANIGVILKDSRRRNWASVGNDLSASLALRTRYLRIHEFEDWLESVFAIECLSWRANLVVWLSEVLALFRDEPVRFDQLESLNLEWAWSHLLKYEVASTPSRNDKWEILERKAKQIDLDGWLRSIETDAILAEFVEPHVTAFRESYFS
ncbi:MAG: hypothetical protein AAF654_15010 [Myxococcota bacterium]